MKNVNTFLRALLEKTRAEEEEKKALHALLEEENPALLMLTMFLQAIYEFINFVLKVLVVVILVISYDKAMVEGHFFFRYFIPEIILIAKENAPALLVVFGLGAILETFESFLLQRAKKKFGL